MSHYSRKGKQTRPISPEQFLKFMEAARWPKRRYKRMEKQSFCAMLYYTGARLGEVLRARREQFVVDKGILYFDVLERMKHGFETAPLPIPLDLPYVDTVPKRLRRVKAGDRLWPWHRVTGYNWCWRVFHTYPHHLRSSRITNLFEDGHTITRVRSWTGHRDIKNLNSYLGLVEIKKIMETLK